MKFEYTGRHVEVSPAIRRHVEDHFKKLDHIFNDSTLSTHVIIDVEKNRQIGEIVVNWRDHTLTAKDTNADMYMALTRAMAKIEKQAVKLKKKIIDRKQSGKSVSRVAPEPDGHLEATPNPATNYSGSTLCSETDDGRGSGNASDQARLISSWFFVTLTRSDWELFINAKTETSVSSNRDSLTKAPRKGAKPQRR